MKYNSTNSPNNYKPSPKGHKKKRHTKVRPAMTLLRSLTSNLVFNYAGRFDDSIPASLTADYLRSLINSNRSKWRPTLTNSNYADHFTGVDTFFFQGQGDYRQPATLVMIDIDVLKKGGLGTPKGARRFAKFLQTKFQNLYCESSTGGKGIHCYLILDKQGRSPQQVNQALNRLQVYLRHLAKISQADIELVEIKGHCPIVHRLPSEGRRQALLSPSP